MAHLTDCPEYNSWSNARRRCHNPGHSQFPSYGARGIIMCDRWRKSFSAFLADMGRRPSPDHSIDRIDNDGNYEPGNCRWATAAEQANNKRNNVFIEAHGERLSLHEWASKTGLKYGTIRIRLFRGFTPEQAVTFRHHQRDRHRSQRAA